DSSAPADAHPGDPMPEMEQPPMTDLAIRAEQALLGEMLQLAAAGSPRPMAGAAAVRPSDFYRPHHRAVFEAADRLRIRRCLPTPQAVLAELAADPDLPRSLAADGLKLIDLMEASTGPATMPVAAQLIVEAALRRRVHEWAIHLRQI